MLKYQEIYKDLEGLMRKNMYREGDKLPSIRELSSLYHCNKSTIIKALEELEKDRLIYAVPKSGYYVIKTKFTVQKPSKILNFSSMIPQWSLFPYIDFQQAISKAIDFYRQNLFVYGPSKGFDPLIKEVKKLFESSQVFTKLDNIFIVSGVQQALYILSQLSFPNGKQNILIEQPSYHVYTNYLNSRLSNVLGIRRSIDGINFVELEQMFKEKNIKFFYTIPRFHNPLGTSWTKSEKIELLKLANRYDVYIVEDDYLADLDQNLKIDPIFSYDEHKRVIYLKSFSKVIFPSMRLAAAVIPDPIITAFDQYKYVIDINTSMISQASLEIYIKSGMFRRNKKLLASSYQQLSLELQKAMKENKFTHPDIKFSYSGDSPSTKATIWLPQDHHIPTIIDSLKKKNIIIESITSNYLTNFKQENIIKLDVSSIPLDRISLGIKKIVHVINQQNEALI